MVGDCERAPAARFKVPKTIHAGGGTHVAIPGCVSITGRLAIALAAFAALAGQPSDARADSLNRFGLALGAGVPDGVEGSLVIRPSDRIRLYGGGAYNMISPGAHVGATVIAFPFVITPALSVEAGRMFKGDANPLMEMISGRPSDSESLRDVSYDYLAVRAGIELGFSRVTLFAHAGMSAIDARFPNIGSDNDPPSTPESNPTTVRSSHATARIVSPSVKAGLILYF